VPKRKRAENKPGRKKERATSSSSDSKKERNATDREREKEKERRGKGLGRANVDFSPCSSSNGGTLEGTLERQFYVWSKTSHVVRAKVNVKKDNG